MCNHEPSAAACALQRAPKRCPATLLTAVPHVTLYVSANEHEELIFEVAPGEAPLALNSILKGFIGCKLRTWFNLWK